MDVKMPVFDGIHAAKKILDGDWASCVVMLTAYSDTDIVERASRAGVTGFLVKPIEDRLILPTIELALAQNRKLKKLNKEAEAQKKQLEDIKLIENAKALLADAQGITEREAYARMRKLSMDKRCSLGALAEGIVEQHDRRGAVAEAKAYLMKRDGLSESAAYKTIRRRADAGRLTPEQAAVTILREREER
jgi:response regulator NasT